GAHQQTRVTSPRRARSAIRLSSIYASFLRLICSHNQRRYFTITRSRVPSRPIRNGFPNTLPGRPGILRPTYIPSPRYVFMFSTRIMIFSSRSNTGSDNLWHPNVKSWGVRLEAAVAGDQKGSKVGRSFLSVDEGKKGRATERMDGGSAE